MAQGHTISQRSPDRISSLIIFSQSAHLECPLINLLHKLGALPNVLGFHLVPYIQAVRLC